MEFKFSVESVDDVIFESYFKKKKKEYLDERKEDNTKK